VKRTRNKLIVPCASTRSFFGDGIPGVKAEELAGKLIAVEGADGSGRSTQIALLVEWLETSGHATVQVGLKRSTLVSDELDRAQNGNILSRTTLSLFYATDFADQLENVILPSLKAGFVVLADRYIYTLMARDMVRGMDEQWLKNLYGIALKPDAVFYLASNPRNWCNATSPRPPPWTTGKAVWTSACRATCSTASSNTRRRCRAPSGGCKNPTASPSWMAPGQWTR
jgi:hypothetical protein